MHSRLVLFGLALLAPFQISEVTGADVSAAPQAPSCELHLWPTDRIRLNIGSSGNWRYQGSYEVHETFETPDIAPPPSLTHEGQADRLLAMQLPDLVGMPGARVVMHDQPLPRAEADMLSIRHSDSDADCYGELILNDIFVENVFARPRQVRILATFLRFDGAAPAAPRRLATSATGAFSVPKDAGREEMDTAIGDAFQSSVRKFTSYVQRSFTKPGDSSR